MKGSEKTNPGPSRGTTIPAPAKRQTFSLAACWARGCFGTIGSHYAKGTFSRTQIRTDLQYYGQSFLPLDNLAAAPRGALPAQIPGRFTSRASVPVSPRVDSRDRTLPEALAQVRVCRLSGGVLTRRSQYEVESRRCGYHTVLEESIRSHAFHSPVNEADPSSMGCHDASR